MWKLYVAEWKKLFFQRTVFLTCIGMIVANILTFCVTEQSYGRYTYRGEYYRQFQKLYDKPETVKQRIKSMERADALSTGYEYYYGLCHKQVSAKEYEEQKRQLIKTYGTEILKELDYRIKKTDLQTNRAFAFYARQWKEQAEYIKEYKVFRNGMKERGENLESFSVFSKGSSFSNKNLVKTVKDYEKLGNVNISLGNYYGIQSFLKYPYEGIFLTCMAFVFAAALWKKERNMLTLVKSGKRGKSVLFFSKVGVLVAALFLMTILCAGTELYMGQRFYGLGDVSASIQSIQAYRNCCLPITIGQGIFLCILTKAVTASIIGVFFFLLFIWLQDNGFLYLLAGGAVVISIVCYCFILPASNFAWIKYINPVLGLQPMNLYGTYRNLNLFGHPVSLLPCFVGFLLLLTICLVLVACYFWCTGKKAEKKTIGQLPLSNKVRGGIGILRVQCFEFFIRQKKGIFCILLLLYGCYAAFSSQEKQYQGYSPEEYFVETLYKEDMEELEGVLTAEKEEKIQKREKYYDELWKQIEQIETKKNISAQENAKLTGLISQTGFPEQAFEKVKEQYKMVKARQKNGKNAVLLDEYAWNGLFKNEGREVRNIMLAAIATVFLCGSIFMDRKNVNHLIGTTKNGRRVLWRRKYLLGAASAALSWLCLVLPEIIQFLREKPVYLMSAALGNLPLLQQVKEEVSIGVTVFVLYLCSLFLCMLIAFFTMFLVNITNDSTIIMAAMATGILLFSVMLLNNDIGIFGTIVLKSSYPVRNLCLILLLFMVLLTCFILFWECELFYPKRKVGNRCAGTK